MKDPKNTSQDLTEFHKKRNELAIKAVSKMQERPYTAEQFVEQTERVIKFREKISEEDAAFIQEELQNMTAPLKFRNSAKIYRWLFRNQITFDKIPLHIQEEFIKTHHYKTLKKNNK